MNTLPLKFLTMIFAGWVNRHQQDVIEYLQEENRSLLEQLGGRRLRFTDQQRRRLAVKAKAIGRKRLFEIGTLVTPDTWLRCLASAGEGGVVRDIQMEAHKLED